MHRNGTLNLRLRRGAAPVDAPNEGLPARANRFSLHRSPRRNASVQLSLRRAGAQDLRSFGVVRNLLRPLTPQRP
jgi:hypothetical protein